MGAMGSMAKVCEVCGKRPSFGNQRSHSMRATKRRWLPNVQRVRVKLGKTTRRMSVCTSCLKADKVRKAG